MVLVRHLVGEVLREERVRQSRTLRDVSVKATVSLGYLSEVERGVKEASSECLASICAALEMPQSSMLSLVSTELRREERALTVLPTPDPAVAGSDVAAA